MLELYRLLGFELYIVGNWTGRSEEGNDDQIKECNWVIRTSCHRIETLHTWV